MKNLKISVIGLGYIGLPTAVMFASKGIKVDGIDINQDVIDAINAGKPHFIEPELDILLNKVVRDGSLKACSELKESDVFIIAVPTPFQINSFDQDIPEPDLSFIQSAVNTIAKVIKKGDLVILESTSPVGTTEKISKWLSAKREDLHFPHDASNNPDIKVAYCPERVLPGRILEELITNNRVIGGILESCADAAEEIYKIFVKGKCVKTNSRTAEMSKLVENASRDVSIAFANELSMICDDLDINVWDLISIANLHPRVNILQPGPGVGGHCIAVDPWFIVSSSEKNTDLIQTARRVNNLKPNWVVNIILSKINEVIINNKNFKISIYGLTFKADIDDLRESPSIEIAKKIHENFPDNLTVIDPNVENGNLNALGFNTIDMTKALEDSDIHVLLVDHMEFKLQKPKNGIIIDTRGIWS